MAKFTNTRDLCGKVFSNFDSYSNRTIEFIIGSVEFFKNYVSVNGHARKNPNDPDNREFDENAPRSTSFNYYEFGELMKTGVSTMKFTINGANNYRKFTIN